MALSERNRVIYCTHSHYLLDPQVIPLSNVSVAEKKGTGNIELVPIHEYKGGIAAGTRSAYQPVQDALQLRPFLVDMSDKKVIITEGITDYYVFEMFKKGRAVSIFPSSGAENTRLHISNMIAWQVPFYALWDKDSAGREAKQKAEAHFGQEMAHGRFFLLPLTSRTKNRSTLEDLFGESDKQMILESLGVSQNSDFKKIIAVLYYSPNREDIIRKVSQPTITNFDAVFSMMGIT